MPFREDFFDNFLLRATPVYDLNDPFEGAVTFDHIKDENDILNKFFNLTEEQSYLLNDFLGSTQMDLHDFGIISLTEDPLNPIMWSHYADNHKGFVIQLDVSNSFFDGANKNIKFKEDIFGLVSDIPKSVRYSRHRKLFLFPEEIHPNKKYEFPHKKLYQHLMYTKSNDWMYEKEYRTIVELKNADVILVDNYEYLIEYCRKQNIKFEALENTSRIKISYSKNFELDEECGDECIRDELYRLTMYNNPIYLFKINPNSIKRIIFGCNTIDKNIDTITNKNKNYLNYFKTFILDDRFELNFKQLDNKTEERNE